MLYKALGVAQGVRIFFFFFLAFPSSFSLGSLSFLSSSLSPFFLLSLGSFFFVFAIEASSFSFSPCWLLSVSLPIFPWIELLLFSFFSYLFLCPSIPLSPSFTFSLFSFLLLTAVQQQFTISLTPLLFFLPFSLRLGFIFGYLAPFLTEGAERDHLARLTTAWVWLQALANA